MLALSGPLKTIDSVLRGVTQQKKSITATALLRQQRAMLKTGRCHITLFPR